MCVESNRMNKLTVLGHWISVAHQTPDEDDRGRHLVPGSVAGLVYGREVHAPVAIVLDVGRRVEGLTPGMRIIATKDLGGLVRVGELDVQAIQIHEFDERTNKLVATDEIAAVLTEDETPHAYGRRVIGTPIQTRTSNMVEDIHAQSVTERIVVTSIGSDVQEDVRDGDIITLPTGSHRRVSWVDGDRQFVSVIAENVLAVEPSDSLIRGLS